MLNSTHCRALLQLSIGKGLDEPDGNQTKDDWENGRVLRMSVVRAHQRSWNGGLSHKASHPDQSNVPERACKCPVAHVRSYRESDEIEWKHCNDDVEDGIA